MLMIFTLQFFHVRSATGATFLPFVNNTKTAAHTFTTGLDGDPKDFNSVRLFLSNVLRAASAFKIAGSAFFKSAAQILAFTDTSSSIIRTFFSFSAANKRQKTVKS